MRKVLSFLTAGALLFSLAACSSNEQLANQFKSGTGKNYIAGDGTVTEFAAASRGASVSWEGLTEVGDRLGSSQLTGVPLVINFWYAGCAPCRAEAKDLQALSAEFDGKAQFVGVNVRDTADTAIAFERNFGIQYPSIIDAQTGSVVLAFTGVVSPQAVPTTLVIDKQGRVSARILGRLEKGTLKSLIETVVAE